VKTKVKKITVLTAVVAAFAAPTTAHAATSTITTPLLANFLACNGHTIQLSGQLLSTFSVTFDGAGGVTFATHSQPQGVTGLDLQTGAKYIGTGLTRDTEVFAPSGTLSLTFINRFHIVGTAGAESFDFSATVHFTALPDGTVTAFVDSFSASC
jgi:hypothetical protein